MSLVVQEVDCLMSRLNFYPRNKSIAFDCVYPLGSDRTVGIAFYETIKLCTSQ